MIDLGQWASESYRIPDAETDVFSLKVPISLREEYRISPVQVDYPLCQDTPLYKDQDGSGAYVWMKAGDA